MKVVCPHCKNIRPFDLRLWESETYEFEKERWCHGCHKYYIVKGSVMFVIDEIKPSQRTPQERDIITRSRQENER